MDSPSQEVSYLQEQVHYHRDRADGAFLLLEQEKKRYEGIIEKLQYEVRSLKRENGYQRDALDRVLWGDRPEPPAQPKAEAVEAVGAAGTGDATDNGDDTREDEAVEEASSEDEWGDWGSDQGEPLTVEQQALVLADQQKCAAEHAEQRRRDDERHAELMLEADAVVRELREEEEREKRALEVSHLMNTAEPDDEEPCEGLPKVRLRVSEPESRPRPAGFLQRVGDAAQPSAGDCSAMVVKSHGVMHPAAIPVTAPQAVAPRRPATYAEDKRRKDPEVREESDDEAKRGPAFPKREEAVEPNKPNTVQCSACNMSLLPWVSRCTSCGALIAGGQVELAEDHTDPQQGDDASDASDSPGATEDAVPDAGEPFVAPAPLESGVDFASLLRKSDAVEQKANPQVQRFRKHYTRSTQGLSAKGATGAMKLA